ncbi:MAG: hypothetical protein ACXADY_20240 [Candidatus Hodarchaeales archaeon]|jgi:cysteinyl-tRNA synthetase
MTKKLSDSENIVIREIFKNPHTSLVEIAEVLEKAKDRQTRKSDTKVDVRTVSKFKSVGLRKVKQGLEDLADALRLDRSVQGETKAEIEKEKTKAELLLRNGILIGHDFRIDREVYLFYTVKDQNILPWQDHLCNRNCEDDCTRILKIVKNDHGLDEPNTHDIRDQFNKTIEEIVDKNKDRKKNG